MGERGRGHPRRGVLKDAPELADGRQGGAEAAAVIARPVVLTPVAFEVDAGQVHPEVAWRVRNHGVRPGVETGVT
jgi:hypothetical protein